MFVWFDSVCGFVRVNSSVECVCVCVIRKRVFISRYAYNLKKFECLQKCGMHMFEIVQLLCMCVFLVL